MSYGRLRFYYDVYNVIFGLSSISEWPNANMSDPVWFRTSLKVVEIVDEDGRIRFLLGAHHTGFQADATETGSELQQYINEIQERHPESALKQE